MNKMIVELTKEELDIAIDLIEDYLSEYGGRSEWFDLLEKLKRVHSDKEIISHLKNELHALQSDYKVSLDALALSRQQAYELEDKLNASAT